jgi:uncharacterized protein (TIGR03437 family)
MLQQSRVHARVSLILIGYVFVGCAALPAGDASGNIPNRDGLKQAWTQALYGMEHNRTNEFTAHNAAQNLKLSFGSSETRLIHGNTALALRLVGYGRGAQLQSTNEASLSSTGNRIEYRRGLLREWYVNEPRGLEQGFTFSEQPANSGNGPLEIALEITGSLHPKLRSPREVALLDSTGHAVLRYGDLKAWDARGQELASRLRVESDQIRLVVEDRRAVYPITIDPTVTQIILVPSDGASSARLGQSVAIAGNTAVLGAPSEGGFTGAAYVFVLSGVTWIQQAKLMASDGASGDQFGTSVSLFGGSAVIGAPGNSAQGAAYVFTTTGSTWTQQAKLTASDGAPGDQFGISVSMSGPTALVGASGSASHQGAAYIFTLAGTAWSQQAKLTASDAAAGDQFGGSVSLGATTAVAGALGKSGSTGAAYVFINAGTNWTQQAKLTASDGAGGDEFGYSVAVSGDTVLAGAPVKNCQFNCGTPTAGGIGGAYVFAFSGSSWSQQAELASSDGGGGFGCSVAVSGSTAIVVENYSNSHLMGAAFAFVRSGSNWTQQAKLAASDLVVGDGLIAAAVDGDLAIFGAPGKNSNQGAVYAFVQTGTTWTQNGKLVASDTTSADNFGNALAINGNTALIASPFKASQQGAVYVFVRSSTDGTWSQQAKLTLAFPTDGTYFGQSVSLSGDTAVIGASEAAYVFVRSGTSWTQQAKLTGSDPPVNFGFAVAVDGGTAVVTDMGQNSSQGAAYVFVSSGARWTQQAKLTASGATTNDELGRSVSVSGDTVIVGAAAKNSARGAAYVFSRSGAAWTQQAELTASDGASPDNFGAGVSVSGDMAIVGAYLKNGGIGAAYIFVNSGGNWSQQAELTPIDPSAKGIFGTTVSINGNSAVVGSYKGNGGLGEAYVFAQSGTNWTLSMQLKAANGLAGDEFGLQVSVSGGTVIVGAPSHAGGEGAVYVFPFPTLPSSGIVNAASFAHTVAPGSIVSMFGTNFANSPGAASVKPLPDTLNGISILVNNVTAPLIYVNQLQANFQIPFETQPGVATVVVTANGLESQAATVNVSAVETGIFQTGTNQAVVLNPDNSVADSASPAKVGSVVVMYVTGLGPLDHPLPTGSPALSNPLSNATVIPTVTIGGANAVVQFAGMSPGFVGLGQINMVVPKLANGTYPVVVAQGGQTSNNPVMSVTQ